MPSGGIPTSSQLYNSTMASSPPVSGSLDETGIVIKSSASGGGQDLLNLGLFCCSSGLSSPSLPSHIPFCDILWCEDVSPSNNSYADSSLTNCVVSVSYFDQKASSPKIKRARIILRKPSSGQDNEVADQILAKAYGKSLIKPRLLVLVNPHGGKGTATRIYRSQIEPVLLAAQADITYIQTKYSRHAVDVARDLDIDQYDVIVCCSGDGIPYEVINGFYQRSDKGAGAFNKIAISQLPCGSGNALTLSTHGTSEAGYAAVRLLKASRAKMDVMAVTQGEGTDAETQLSFLSQCFGVIADSDIGTEHLRWMGQIRFDIGVAQYVYQHRSYPCDLYVKYVADNHGDISKHYGQYLEENIARSIEFEPEERAVSEKHFILNSPDLALPVPEDWVKIPNEITDCLLIFYTGNMPVISKDMFFFPAALPNDGAMDLILMDNKASFFQTAHILYSADRGLHINDDKVFHAKILAYRLIPRLTDSRKHFISVDGENCPVRTTQAEVIPAAVTVLLHNNSYVETNFR